MTIVVVVKITTITIYFIHPSGKLVVMIVIVVVLEVASVAVVLV